MAEIDFLGGLHSKTRRDYVARVLEHDKSECAAVAKQWGYDYWDGERQFGYGGYSYDGRWRPVAEAMATHYGLKAGDKVLDVGCGKAYLLYELTQVVPGIEVAGIDISAYGIEHAKEEVQPYLTCGTCTDLPWNDDSFDYVFSLTALHNLYNFELKPSIQEIERVSRRHKYISVESYRNEREKMNLLYWQLTCESFLSTEEWQWLYGEYGYTGDYGYIFFE